MAWKTKMKMKNPGSRAQRRTKEACEAGVEAESALGGEGPDICKYLPEDKVMRGPVAVLNSRSGEIVEYLG